MRGAMSPGASSDVLQLREGPTRDRVDLLLWAVANDEAGEEDAPEGHHGRAWSVRGTTVPATLADGGVAHAAAASGAPGVVH